MFKAPEALHVDPLNFSVTPEPVPNAKAAFCVPDPAKPCLAVFKLPVAAQLVPLNFSVTAETAPVDPPNERAAF